MARTADEAPRQALSNEAVMLSLAADDLRWWVDDGEKLTEPVCKGPVI